MSPSRSCRGSTPTGHGAPGKVLAEAKRQWAAGAKNFWSQTGLLSQGGCPAPLASRLHRIPTHFLLNLRAI
jgi:hypothetical protein